MMSDYFATVICRGKPVGRRYIDDCGEYVSVLNGRYGLGYDRETIEWTCKDEDCGSDLLSRAIDEADAKLKEQGKGHLRVWWNPKDQDCYELVEAPRIYFEYWWLDRFRG